jgi:hypothetical protein
VHGDESCTAGLGGIEADIGGDNVQEVTASREYVESSAGRSRQRYSNEAGKAHQRRKKDHGGADEMKPAECSGNGKDYSKNDDPFGQKLHEAGRDGDVRHTV